MESCIKISPFPYGETETFTVFCPLCMTITKYSELQQKINLHKDPDIIHIKNIKKKQRNVAQIDLPCELLLSF